MKLGECASKQQPFRQASWSPRGFRARERYSFSTWKFHLEAVRDTASKCAPFQRVHDLDRNSLKLIQTNVRNNTLARCYGIEIRTVTITLHWVNRKVPIWDSISQTVSIWHDTRSWVRDLGLERITYPNMYLNCGALTKLTLFSFDTTLSCVEQWVSCCWACKKHIEMIQWESLEKRKSQLQMSALEWSRENNKVGRLCWGT